MQSAFGIEHGDDAVSKGFFSGLMGKAPKAKKLEAPKNAKPAGFSAPPPSGPATTSVPGSTKGAYDKGLKTRKWAQKNPVKAAGAAGGVGAAGGGVSLYGADKTKERYYG